MGTRIRRLFTAAVVVFGVTTAAAAQSVPSAHSSPLQRGIVHDRTGKPIPGAVVTLEHPQENTVRVVVTDLWGEYEVGHLESGTRYDVRISHPDFRPARLQAGAGDHVNVHLKPRRSSTAEERPGSSASLR